MRIVYIVLIGLGFQTVCFAGPDRLRIDFNQIQESTRMELKETQRLFKRQPNTESRVRRIVFQDNPVLSPSNLYRFMKKSKNVDTLRTIDREVLGM